MPKIRQLFDPPLHQHELQCVIFISISIELLFPEHGVNFCRKEPLDKQHRQKKQMMREFFFFLAFGTRAARRRRAIMMMIFLEPPIAIYQVNRYVGRTMSNRITMWFSERIGGFFFAVSRCAETGTRRFTIIYINGFLKQIWEVLTMTWLRSH